jgi:hypothetical protein
MRDGSIARSVAPSPERSPEDAARIEFRTLNSTFSVAPAEGLVQERPNSSLRAQGATNTHSAKVNQSARSLCALAGKVLA